MLTTFGNTWHSTLTKTFRTVLSEAAMKIVIHEQSMRPLQCVVIYQRLLDVATVQGSGSWNCSFKTSQNMLGSGSWIGKGKSMFNFIRARSCLTPPLSYHYMVL